MSKLVREDACGESMRAADLMQVVSESLVESHFNCRTAQQPAVRRRRFEGVDLIPNRGCSRFPANPGVPRTVLKCLRQILQFRILSLDALLIFLIQLS
jgi:hypothetical protein